MPGEKSYGFHEGSRSEYLAQYAFASWGTAVVIPQQEDHGLDLHCTLMERVGRRFLARSPYTVQVKSEMKPVVFEGTDAVRWVIEHPLPFFLCIVDKATARLSVYQTLARFHVWSLGLLPDRLSMIPQPRIPGQDGQCINWPGNYDLSLDQPILEFTVNGQKAVVFLNTGSTLKTKTSRASEPGSLVVVRPIGIGRTNGARWGGKRSH